MGMLKASKFPPIGVFSALLLLLLLARVWVFYYLNLQYIDSDQPLMWRGAFDYSHGQFNEPRYFGQNYNTLLEGLFAAPLLWAGVKVYVAVPLVTHVLFLFPFLFSAFYLYAKQMRAQAILLLAMVVCMPVEFDMLSSLPRGFVTGLFFCSFFIVSLLQPKHLLWLHVNAALGVIAFFVNQNSILVSAPIALYLFLENYRSPKFYSVLVTVVLTYVAMYFLLDRYYVTHQGAALVKMRVVFSINDLLDSLAHLDDRFVHISYFATGKSITIFLVVALLLLASWQQKRNLFYALLAFLFIIVLSFSFQKNIEGCTWPFYSFSRSYLGIPLLLGLFATQVQWHLRYSNWLVIIPFLFGAYKLNTVQSVVEEHVQHNYYIVVYKLDYALEAIEVYKKRCAEAKVSDFFISKRFWLNSILVYGGPAVDPDFPTTLEVEDDRRHWLMQQYSEKTVTRFMLVAGSNEFHTSVYNADSAFKITPIDGYGLYLIEDNTLKTKDFLKRFKDVEFRKQL